nr:unnamed protein product [Haemonchus contortus]
MPIMYCRYIDDCCVITSTQQEMDELFTVLNQQSHYIKFTREVPRGLVSGGQFEEYPTPLKICSPRDMKRAVVPNMYRTATGVCTGEVEREKSRKLATGIANMAMGHCRESQA